MQETTRNESLKKIESTITSKITQLKKNPVSVGKFTKTLCIFGWIKNGKVSIKVIGTSKKLPYVYMASKKPFIKPFRDILKASYDVLLVTLDQKTARIQKFHGNQIIQESKLRIDLQGRHKKEDRVKDDSLEQDKPRYMYSLKKLQTKSEKWIPIHH